MSTNVPASTSPASTHGRSRPRSLRRRIRMVAAAAAVLAAMPLAAAAVTPAGHTHTTRPTVVLVHGAWADGSSWNGEVRRLQRQGYAVRVAPNPLRGLAEDSADLSAYLGSITGPIVLVGHSYGGAVITNAATGNANVKALVYIDAYIPDAGQTVSALSGPDSALAPAASDPTSVFTLVPYPGAPTGIYDTYVLPRVFVTAFAADLPRRRATVLAASQPPTSLLALGEPSGTPAWTTIPSWDLVGRQDRVIPRAQQLVMARHAGARITQIDSSHLSLISHPGRVTDLIVAAAEATD